MGEFNSPTPELDKRIPGTIKLVQLFWGEVPGKNLVLVFKFTLIVSSLLQFRLTILISFFFFGGDGVLLEPPLLLHLIRCILLLFSTWLYLKSYICGRVKRIWMRSTLYIFFIIEIVSTIKQKIKKNKKDSMDKKSPTIFRGSVGILIRIMRIMIPGAISSSVGVFSL